jgi:hypothetical protein
VFGSSLREEKVDISSFYVRFLEYSRKLVAQGVKFKRKPMFKKLGFYLVNYYSFTHAQIGRSVSILEKFTFTHWRIQRGARGLQALPKWNGVHRGKKAAP